MLLICRRDETGKLEFQTASSMIPKSEFSFVTKLLTMICKGAAFTGAVDSEVLTTPLNTIPIGCCEFTQEMSQLFTGNTQAAAEPKYQFPAKNEQVFKPWCPKSQAVLPVIKLFISSLFLAAPVYLVTAHTDQFKGIFVLKLIASKLVWVVTFPAT